MNAGPRLVMAALATLMEAEHGAIERAIHQLSDRCGLDVAGRLQFRASIALLRGAEDREFWPVIAAMGRVTSARQA